jgi:hypothetical protein
MCCNLQPQIVYRVAALFKRTGYDDIKTFLLVIYAKLQFGQFSTNFYNNSAKTAVIYSHKLCTLAQPTLYDVMKHYLPQFLPNVL